MGPTEECLPSSGLLEVSTAVKFANLPEHEVHVDDGENGLDGETFAEAASLKGNVVENPPSELESDSEFEEDTTKKHPRVGERRKAQNLIFSSW